MYEEVDADNKCSSDEYNDDNEDQSSKNMVLKKCKSDGGMTWAEAAEKVYFIVYNFHHTKIFQICMIIFLKTFIQHLNLKLNRNINLYLLSCFVKSPSGYASSVITLLFCSH